MSRRKAEETKIKVFIMDVDGTMTDGKIYMGQNGEMFKAFDIKDGYGIHEMLPEYGVKTVIMTGRKSDIVLNRAKELEIDYILQGVKDKEAAIKQLSEELQCDTRNMAYIGDDMIDVPAMKLCGVRACPRNAVSEVRKLCEHISSVKGGNGAVRDFIEWLIKEKYIE